MELKNAERKDSEAEQIEQYFVDLVAYSFFAHLNLAEKRMREGNEEEADLIYRSALKNYNDLLEDEGVRPVRLPKKRKFIIQTIEDALSDYNQRYFPHEYGTRRTEVA